MSDTPPFIYVAALRRSGSTALKDAFTARPHSIVFGEPRLFHGRIRISGHDARQLRRAGVDGNVRSFADLRFPSAEDAVDRFRNQVVPLALRAFRQVGIKEIRHAHWQLIAAAFPSLRVIVTARDPRDVYLSLYAKKVGRRFHPRGIDGDALTPQVVADHLLEEFTHQRAMLETLVCKTVRYEDLCTHPDLLTELRRFTHNDIDDVGGLGTRLGRRSWIHGRKFTDKAVGRWRREKRPKLLAELDEVVARTKEYMAFWDYSR